jgi:hypothetical protein
MCGHQLVLFASALWVNERIPALTAQASAYFDLSDSILPLEPN